MRVRDHMSVPPLAIPTNADYKSALELMREHGVHHVPVLGPEGELAGIVTERDLLLAAMHYLQAAVEVADVMHRDVVVVKADTPLAHAAALLARHKIGGLPVVDDGGRLIGMITETDLLGALIHLLDSVPQGEYA